MAYSLVAVDFMSAEALYAALTRVANSAATGAIKPLPHTTHSINSVSAAMRQMSQARHMGKIVVRMPADGAAQVQPAGSVVVTGGLGTLGQLVTCWLQQQAAESIHLLGRSGVAVAGSAAGITGSRAAVTISKADISMSADLAAVLGTQDPSASSRWPQQQQQHHHPLQGILHASGVLADATVANQTLAGLRAVFGPKAAPAESWGHQVAVQPAPLLVLFSSVASLLGAPGQINYSGASGLLDGLAQQAQAQVGDTRCCTGLGLPAGPAAVGSRSSSSAPEC